MSKHPRRRIEWHPSKESNLRAKDSLAKNICSGFINRACVFVLLVFLTFILPRMMPGDSLDLILTTDVARSLSPTETEILRGRIGLSGTYVEQFVHYVLTLLQGDLGYSYLHAAPVLQVISAALPWTALIVLAALPVYLLIGVFLGIEAALYPRSKHNKVAATFMILLASIPPFTAAILVLLLFAILLPIFPVAGAQSLFPPDSPFDRAIDIAKHAVLPCLALTLHEVVRYYYFARGEALSLDQRPFITNAKARGISGWQLRVRYFGANILPSILARLSDTITALIGGVIYIEIVFSYPGMGHLIFTAIVDRDYILLQGAVLTLALLVLSLNWLLDSTTAALAKRG